MIKREPGDLRQTITHRITQRFFVRWHMAAILVCVRRRAANSRARPRHPRS